MAARAPASGRERERAAGGRCGTRAPHGGLRLPRRCWRASRRARRGSLPVWDARINRALVSQALAGSVGLARRRPRPQGLDQRREDQRSVRQGRARVARRAALARRREPDCAGHSAPARLPQRLDRLIDRALAEQAISSQEIRRLMTIQGGCHNRGHCDGNNRRRSPLPDRSSPHWLPRP